MIRKLFPFILLAILFASPSFAQPKKMGNVIPGEIMVQVQQGTPIEAIQKDFKKWQGKTTKTKVVRKVSENLNIWLLEFAPAAVDQEAFLEAVKNNDRVAVAQFNHTVELRKSPNDPQYASPENWPYDNDGTNGGVVDADIDATDAWDITTGGQTVNGDTIVVAVVDGGFDISHEDLDIYKNWAEVNGTNGVDDDGNGYMDDVNGWDAYDNDGTIGSASHGTHVAGTVGGIGDNNTGFVGVNWNVKVMPIQGSSSDESTVVSAYDYALTMRKLYNNTNGSEGAFVVATNSSFGVNNADPANYPLWCGMYDSLGSEGILSAVAGPNQNINIDVDGDVPGACPSDYTLSITNTDNSDVKGTAGYGQINCDMGSPGTNILSTEPSNTYGQKTGTSMATPHVAGAVALLYSVSCPDLMSLASSYPDSLAGEMKKFLMQGTDYTADLDGITVTNGRLNVYKAMLKMDSLGYCDTVSGCFTPYGLNVVSYNDSSASLHWTGPDSSTFDIQVREVGNTTWMTYNSNDDSLYLNNLQGCTDYEFQVQSHCQGGDSSDFSASSIFKTLGCCNSPSGFQVNYIGNTSASFHWDSVYAANSYEFLIRPQGAMEWDTTTTIYDSLFYNGLDSCVHYEARIRTICDTGASSYSSPISFTTTGCSNCNVSDYCPSSGADASYEWLEEVQFGPMSNLSGNDGGYADYTNMGTNIYVDSTYSIALKPEFDNTVYDEYFRVWIDFDHDGTFNMNDELVYEDGPVNATSSGTVTIPSTVAPGEETMMRVSMKFDSLSTACEDPFDYGEVEDYCVTILGDSLPTGFEGNTSSAGKLLVYPNPARDRVYLENTGSEAYEIEILGPVGKVVKRLEMERNKAQINLNDLASGIYFYRAVPREGKGKPQQGKIVIEK